MATTLGELLSEQELSHLEDLVSRRKITTGWIQDVFIPRLSEDLDNIDYWQNRYDAQSVPLEDDRRKVLQYRRDHLFQRALDSDYTTKLERELSALHRGVLSEAGRLPEYLKEAGPLGVAKDVGKSLVESIPRGIEATGKTFKEGLGEQPLQRIGEMTGAVPIVGGVSGGLARLLGRSALRSAGKSVIRSAGIQALKDAPEEAVKAALASGVGSTRGGLAKALSKVAEGTRYPGYAGEGADIAGAGEDVYVEGFLELVGEGAVEGGRFAGRRAVDQLKGETADPIQQKQQQRAADNDTAAATSAQRARGPQAQAAVDALALQLLGVTHQFATGKNEPSVDDLYRITPEAFVNAFENHVAPGFANAIAELEGLGIHDAGNVIRANILDLHQRLRQELDQQLAPQGETPEQAAAADMAGQPPQETTDGTTETTETAERTQQADTTPEDTPASDTVPDDSRSDAETDTETSSPTTDNQQPTTEKDWAGLDVDVGNEVLEALSQDPDADMEAAVDTTIGTLVENQVLSPEDGEALKTKVVEQITPAVEELRRNNIPPEQIGPERVGYWSDENPDNPIRVRLVVRELEDLIPSHDTEGNLRADYPEGLQPREQRSGPVAVQKNKEDASRFNPESAARFSTNFAHGPPLTSKQHPRSIIAGTGRRTMLEIVRDNYPEKWEALQQINRQELEAVGMDPSILDGMTAPVISYELVSDLDEVELAKDTNRDALLGHSSTEEAAFDAELLAGDVLHTWNDDTDTDFLKALQSPENENFRKQIISRIPRGMQPQFLTRDNRQLSEAGQKRLLGAMIRYVFSGPLGENFGKQLIDTGSGGNITLDAVLRNAIPSLAKMKAEGIDISEHLTRAVDRFITFDNTAATEASSNENKNRETGPLTKEELLWRNIETSFASLSFDPEPLIENQLLYLIYAKKKGNAYTDAIRAFQELARDAIQLKRTEPDADAIVNTERIATRMIIDYLVSEAYVIQAEQQSLDVLIDRMPPEVRDIRMAYEQTKGAEAKKAAAEAQIMEIVKLMNQGQQTEAAPDATQTETETETTTPDTRVAGTGPGTPGGAEPNQPQGTPDRDATGTPATPESPSGVAPDQPRGTDSDATRTAEGTTDGVPPDDRGESVNVLADRIDPDRHPGASARQLFTLAVVEHLRFTDQPLTEAQLIAGYSKATGFDVATHVRSEAMITDMHSYVDAAIEETLAKKDVQDKGITREDLEARLPTQREGTPDDTSVPTDDQPESSDVSQDNDQAETPGETSTRGDDVSTTPAPEDEVVDTNQVVGVSRRSETPESTVSPVVQRALDTLGITTTEWEQLKADGGAIAFLNNQPQETIEQIDAVGDLAGDVAGEMPADEMVDEDLDIDDDEDFFNDVVDGRLRDITDQQRSDFDVVRRKLFLAKTIGRLEAKGQDRTPIETAQLRALTAPQRTDAQQEIYERLLQAFVDNQVARLQAKDPRSATENRILETLVAVQAEGLPEEASDKSLYADLDTPDQAHSSPLAETRTLAGVQAPATADTELNLPETVTADTDKLSQAQQTSVKAIVAAFLRKIHTTTDTTVQGGFLLADKPGVGKTRQALATIWHYMRQGINRHFVLAPNPQLLNNYIRDMNNMGGDAGDISNYTSSQQVSTPIGTATYSMLIRTPNYKELSSRADGQDRIGTTGFQNAIADIVEHLTGARPTFAQTHPGKYQAQREAFMRIFPDTSADISTVEKAIAELQKQASRINLKNQQAVEQFRARVTPRIADLLLSPQGELFEGGSDLYQRVWELMAFGETVLAAQPDPDFNAKAEAFEGVIVLDEMHKATGTNSQTGAMIATLHQLLPNAKFLYMSATPFKEIDNFWVAERLGLWGANQPFPTFSHFARAFKRAARAVKEIVPLHLKQIGRYVSRALSSKETRYTPVEIPLSDTEKRQYDTAVQLVQGIRGRFEAALDTALRSSWGSMLEMEGEHGKYRAKYMRMFYGETQKFFLAVLDAMKAQGLTENIREKLLAGDKVIVQLENTWEQSIERAKARGKREGTIGPFDLLIDFVENENLFPIHEHITEVRTRRDGSQYTVVVPRMTYDNDGQQVRAVDQNLKRLQTQLIEALHQEMRSSVFTASEARHHDDSDRVASEGLPFAADIIHTIALEAGATSAEISGRSEIYPRDNPQRMPQDTESRDARTAAFSKTTDLNLIVLGPAGLTGINLPIVEEIKDKVGALYHYLVQSSWNVNTFEQGLGRGKRADSAIDPHYMIAHQDLPGADRVLGATLAKFAEMGALAGQADNALMQNIDKVEGETSLDDDPEADVDTDVFDTEEAAGERGHIFGLHGQEALAQLWKDIYESGDFSLVDTLGLTRPELAGATGMIDPQTIPTVQQFFSRLLHQSTENQPQFYQQFEERLKRIITYKKELGQLDVGASNLNSKDGQIRDRLTIFTDPDTGQTAEVVRLDVKRQLPRRSWEFTQKVIRGEPGYEHHGGNRFEGIYTDTDGHVWAVFEHPFREDGEVVYTRWGPRGTPVQGIHQGETRITAEELETDFTRLSHPNQPQLTDIDEAKRLWEAEDTTADADVDSELFMATGLILPKWRDLATRQYRHAVMGIIPMIDGSHLHGRVIPSAALSEVLRQIGGVDPNYFDTDSDQTTPAEAPPNGEGSDIDIPAIVRDIIGQQTDTHIAARLNNIVEHIHKKLPLRLRGHLVRSAAEAALLGQLIRDPQVEHTWIVYRKNDRIVKIEPMSLNRKGETYAGDFAHIKRVAAEEGADAILRIHNHPSGVAKWSDPDKRAAMHWHKELGTLMAEDIIVDSGTYAYRTFENGEYTWHEDTVLDPDAVEFDTSAETVADTSGEQKPTDPLYQNPLIRGAREAATYMMGLKRRTDVAEMIFVDKRTGKIVDTLTDTVIRNASNPARALETALTYHQGQQVHIALWGDDAAVSLARSLQGVEGVDSVWVNSQRVTGIEHIGQQTQDTDADGTVDDATDDEITIQIGDEDHTLIRVPDDDSDTDTDTLSDVITDLITDLKKWWDRLTQKQKSDIRKKRKFTKPVVIAGIEHELVPDSGRRLRNRFDRGIDAEHMTRGDEADRFKQILESGEIKATHPIGPGATNAYFSYGPFYRRNENRHDYGVILDLEAMLRSIPGIKATIHRRGSFDARKPLDTTAEIRQALRDNQIGHPDTVIEIIVPQDVKINAYLAGVVMDNKVYAKPEYLVKNQLTSKRLPAESPTTKSAIELTQEIRDLKAKIKKLTAEVKPKFDRAIAEEQNRIQRLNTSIDRRDKEINKLHSDLHFNRTKTPHTDKNRISTLKFMLTREIDQRRDAELRLQNLRKREGTLFFATPVAADELKAKQQELKLATRQLRELQNPRQMRKGILLKDYQPSAETPNINRATRAMPTQDQLTLQGKGKQRKFISPQSQLFEKLRLWTPKLREHKRVLMNAVRSGYGLLEELKAPPNSDKPGPGDVLEDMLDQRMHLSQTWTGRTRSILSPVLKKLQQQVKRADPENAKPLRAAVDFDIINFIEHNTPLRVEFRAFEKIATEIKEAWRTVNQSYLEAMIKLIRDIGHREEITKVGSQGRVKWSPEPMGAGNDTMKWDWSRAGGDGRFVGKDGTEYTIAQAFARADKLWYPHDYDRSRLRDYNRNMEDLVKALNTLAAKGDAASGDALATAGVEKVSGGYLHKQLKITFPDLDAVIAYYTEIRDRTATLIKMYEDGTIGMYPHLERVRETQDRLYSRKTDTLMTTSALLWDRFAEIATFGQIDSLGHLPPRLATIIQTVEHFNANERETALMAVIDGLQATKASRIAAGDEDQGWGMHESIFPGFEGGESAALRIMQQWEDYYIDKDGKKVKTGKWKGIDINQLGLDQRTLGILEQIGFIQPDGEGGWQVHGKTDAAQQTTIARFFVELAQTKASRKRKVQELVQALGHWQQQDPLTEEGGELWKRMNTLVSIGALGWKQALQNLTEIPVVMMLSGTKATAGMVSAMRDPDFRAAASALTEGLKQGVEFLADDNLQETYLNSKWSMFGYTERVSRMIGVGVGLTHAKNLSRELLASKEGSKNRGRIEREMRRLRMNPDAILQMQPDQLNTIFAEVIQRIKDQQIALAGLELPSATPAKNELTDRIGEEFVRSAMYISDAVFKPYDARTLPDAFNSKDPRFRVFLKFKGWMLQQNRFIVDQYKRAYQEARQHGNYRPLRNMLASTLMLTGSVGMTQGLYALLQGRGDEDDKLLRAFLHTQTLGLGAVLWEMAVRSEGSPWRLEKTFEGTVVGPVWGTFADILSPTATGDLDRTLQEIMQRTPGTRELLQVGVDTWWEDE